MSGRSDGQRHNCRYVSDVTYISQPMTFSDSLLVIMQLDKPGFNKVMPDSGTPRKGRQEERIQKADTKQVQKCSIEQASLLVFLKRERCSRKDVSLNVPCIRPSMK